MECVCGGKVLGETEGEVRTESENGERERRVKDVIKFKQYTMKTMMFSLFFVLMSTVSFGQKMMTSQIQTNAQCGDCKERIEGKLNYTKGIKFAELDDQTKIVTIKYDPNKISLQTIKETIAKIGYDADEVKAAQEDVEKLPKCCQPRGHE